MLSIPGLRSRGAALVTSEVQFLVFMEYVNVTTDG